jgi:O-antigen ligase
MPAIRTITHGNAAADPWYDRAVRVCLYVMIAVVPAAFCPVFYTAFSYPKLLALVLLATVALILWGFKVFVEGKIVLVKGRFNWLLLVFAFITLLNTFFSVAPYSSIYGSGSRFVGILTMVLLFFSAFMAFNFFRDVASIKKMVQISLITAGVLAVYGILQYFGLFDSFLQWNADTGDRVFGTVGHGNHFGAYLGMNILLGVFFFPYVRKRRYHVLLALGLALMAVVLFLTGSRGALFATLIALVAGVIVVIVKKGNYIKTTVKRLPFRVTVLLLILLIAAGFISGEIQGFPLVQRTIGTVAFIQQGNVPDRLSWWASTLEMIWERPILGFGLSTYRDVYNAYRRTDYRAPGPGDMQDLITPEAAHNEYLNMAATQGLVGLGVFLAMVFFVIWGLERMTILEKKPDRNMLLALGINKLLLVYLIQVFVSFGVITTLVYFYVFLGLGAALAGLARNNYEAPLKTFKLPAAVKYLFALVTLGICTGYVFLIARAGLAEYYYKEAMVKSASGDLHGAIADYQHTLLFRPGEYSYYEGFGDFALKNSGTAGLTPDTSLKMLLLAEIEYVNAIGINPYHPSIYYNLGLAQLQVYRMNGNYRYYQSAEGNLDKAVSLAVNNPLYPYQAAKVLLAAAAPASGSAAPAGSVALQANVKALEFLDTAYKIRPDYRDAEKLANGIKAQMAGTTTSPEEALP